MNKSGLPKETLLEKVTGSLPVGICTTVIAAYCPPAAALVPLLTGTLANNRHKERVEHALVAMSDELESQKEALANITDSQYKLINETILAALQATDEEKLQYLRTVLSNAVRSETSPQEADFLSRVIRDISAKEAEFLVNNGLRYIYVNIGKDRIGSMSGSLLEVDPLSEDGLIVTGLISLGLLSGAETTYTGSRQLIWTTVAKKLIALLTEGKQ